MLELQVTAGLTKPNTDTTTCLLYRSGGLFQLFIQLSALECRYVPVVEYFGYWWNKSNKKIKMLEMPNVGLVCLKY